MKVVGRKFGSLFLLLLVSLAAAPRAGAAQDDTARRRAAIKRLVVVMRMASASAHIFDQLVTRYQRNWADSVITDFRARGMFKPYTAADTARIEQLIREMGDNTFAEIKQRAAREIYTDEFMELVAGPELEKLLTAEELESLLAFFETPVGQKAVATAHKVFADTLVASFEERGFFQLLASAELESARIDRLAAEMKTQPPVSPERIVQAWKALPPDHFSAEEKAGLFAFVTTPAAAKLGVSFPDFIRGVMANVAPHTPRMGQLAVEAFNRQTEVFARRLGELNIAPAQGQPKGRRRTRR